ncbi:NB-ARC - like 10, partial [Theobroma cacao]
MDLIGQIIDPIGQSARKYLRYHRKFSEYVDDFKQAQADLNNRKMDIHQQLQDEHRPGKKPKLEVESWFNKVEEKLDHAQRVEDKVSEGTYLFRSCLGKLLDETTQAMKTVYDKGQFSGSLVVNDSSTIAAELPTPEITGGTNVGEEIRKYLMGDEVRMIGVSGMGGIGKTTIMKHVHNRLLKEDKFKKLIWATVSQDFDVRRLQNDIASQLEKTLSDDKNTTIRAGELLEMLRKQGSFLLILDDVWSSFSLEDVGILEPTTDNGCKLVLTTRSEKVVREMDCKKVQVPYLLTDEAMQLFLSKVGQDMLPNPNLESIMKDVVCECGGLPLAIVTIAGCMRGISDPLVWRNALNELRGYIRNIDEMEEKVFRCLRFSYDRMKQKDQDCFLWGALFPEDYVIDKKEIVERWMEAGLIDEMETRQEMQDNGETHATEEIYKYLMGDEVRMIGVCGMGGIGKTTIMKHVHNRLLKETKFGKLICVTVTQDFDVRRLQNKIASQLKKNLSDDEDTTIRAAFYVLILDDVWSSFSLEDVGILEPTRDNGCKLVLTTHSEEVVRSMACKKVQVSCLSTDESMKLFLNKLVGQDMLSNQTLESIMKLVVRECDGLPLAIVTVAGCMRGISDPLVWQNTLNELRGYIRNIKDMEDKVFACLKFSYDRLKQKDQDCFLSCALYPEDYEIEKEEIVEYWMEQGLVDEMETRQAMQGSGHSILRKLEENCLLE